MSSVSTSSIAPPQVNRPGLAAVRVSRFKRLSASLKERWDRGSVGMTANHTLQRTGDHRGRTARACMFARAGAEWASSPAAELGR